MQCQVSLNKCFRVAKLLVEPPWKGAAQLRRQAVLRYISGVKTCMKYPWMFIYMCTQNSLVLLHNVANQKLLRERVKTIYKDSWWLFCFKAMGHFKSFTAAWSTRLHRKAYQLRLLSIFRGRYAVMASQASSHLHCHQRKNDAKRCLMALST